MPTALVVQHVAAEGPGRLGEAISSAGWTAEIRRVDAGEPLPDALDGCAGLIVLGGPMGVGDVDAWPNLRQEMTLLRAAVAGGLPALGICLGGQLLAAALGGAVASAACPEIGWMTVELTPAAARDPLFGGLPSPLPVLQLHCDAFELPKGAALLARSEVCAQAFRVGEAAYGLQFHLETTADMASAWDIPAPPPPGSRAASDGFLARLSTWLRSRRR